METHQDTDILTWRQPGYEAEHGLNSAFPAERVSKKAPNANNGEYGKFSGNY